MVSRTQAEPRNSSRRRCKERELARCPQLTTTIRLVRDPRRAAAPWRLGAAVGCLQPGRSRPGTAAGTMICSVARVGGGPLVPGGSMPPSAGRSAAAGRSHHSQALELTIPMATIGWPHRAAGGSGRRRESRDRRSAGPGGWRALLSGDEVPPGARPGVDPLRVTSERDAEQLVPQALLLHSDRPCAAAATRRLIGVQSRVSGTL